VDNGFRIVQVGGDGHYAVISVAVTATEGNEKDLPVLAGIASSHRIKGEETGDEDNPHRPFL
jgi:hypothetical protein